MLAFLAGEGLPGDAAPLLLMGLISICIIMSAQLQTALHTVCRAASTVPGRLTELLQSRWVMCLTAGP